MKRVPESFYDLKNLRILFLKGNKLNNIPKSILNLNKLTFLYLEDNLLAEKYKKNIPAYIKSTNFNIATETISAMI